MQEQTENINVVIAVPSRYSRLILDDIIDSEPDMHTLALPAGGGELLKVLQHQKADVVLVDNDLPLNENNLVLKRIFSEAPTPVILLVPEQLLSLELVKQASELGVYAIVLKPGKGQYINYRCMAAEVVSKIRAVRQTPHWDTKERLGRLQAALFKTPRLSPERPKATADTIVVIGASTGGTQAVETIVKSLAPCLRVSIIVVVHLPENFTKTFAVRLQELTQLQVHEAQEGMILAAGSILVAPGGKDMVLTSVMGNAANLRVGFCSELRDSFDRPNIDLIMQSVAQSSVRQVIGIILTGMGRDGTKGAGYIKNRGGLVIAQDEDTSLIFGMAKSAIDSGFTDKVLPLPAIPLYINRLAAAQTSVSTTDTTV